MGHMLMLMLMLFFSFRFGQFFRCCFIACMGMGVAVVVAVAKEPKPIPPTEHFVIVKSVQLDKLLSPVAWGAAQNLIRARRCPSGEHITGYRTNKVGKKTWVVTIPCESTQKSTGQYPLTLVVQDDRVTEVELRKYEFLYNSGHIAYITDLDSNDMPEFWLWGYVCECEGDGEPGGCGCDGSVVVEFRNGNLQPWKK